MHALPNTRRNRAKQIACHQIRDQRVCHVEEQLETLAFAPQIAPGLRVLLWRVVGLQR
jgi:hypothetical protein